MSFDATKLIPGKRYRTRDGAIVEFVRAWHWSTVNELQLIWLSCIGDAYGQCYTTDANGLQSTVIKQQGGMDVVSDDPIREPVKVTNHRRICNVHSRGMVYAYKSREDADIAATSDRIGVYELPAEIEVTPIQ